MRNDVSCCAVFFCSEMSVQSGHILWEDHSREWEVGCGHSCCCYFNMSLRICVTSLYSPNMCDLVVFRGQVFWSFLHSAREGGRMVATWGFGVYTCGCGGGYGQLWIWGFWLWISHKVSKLLEKKQPLTPAGKPFCPQIGKASERTVEFM